MCGGLETASRHACDEEEVRDDVDVKRRKMRPEISLRRGSGCEAEVILVGIRSPWLDGKEGARYSLGP